ncbi:hypothetical protein GOB91_29300 [Sinorhizobium meliloti]|nr:hypothetical protein [Sinorhizobium meliloti]MDW9732652.1 hypothetical protein [Sinorhizobium meliloti]
MSKHEFPPFVMVIENGRLVPANPHDAERLNSYRRGTKVFVRFTEEKDRVLVRKWFAIIGLVLKTCETPWKNKDEAHEAIKLALGIVNLSKTVGGAFMQYPKSLTELTEPELQEALDQMTELLSRMTGVDVETLKKETAHIGHEHFHDPADESPSPTSAGDDTGSAPVSSEDGGAASPPSSIHFDWLFNVARMLVAATNPNGDITVLKNQKRAAIEAYPKPEDCPPVISGKAEACFQYCCQIVSGDIEPGDGLALIAGIVGCDQGDLKQRSAA